MLLKQKKRRGRDNQQEDEEIELDFDYIYLMGRTEFAISQEDLEVMSFGKWQDIFHAYRTIWNFKAKKSLYRDVEEEHEEYRRTHQKIDSVMDL